MERSIKSGWGIGGINGWGDPKDLFKDAVTRWLWNWPDMGYGLKNFTSKPSMISAVFNLLAAGMESAQRIKQAVLYGQNLEGNRDSAYSRLLITERVLKVFGEEYFNPEMIGFAAEALSPKDPSLITGPFWTWGNNVKDASRLYALYEWDNFGIYAYVP